MNLYEFFENSYLKFGMKPYIVDKKIWTYKETRELVEVAIEFLVDHNVKCDDKVVICLENSIKYIAMYFAILYMGATVIPIPTTSTYENIKAIIEDSKPNLVIFSVESKSKLFNNEIMHKNLVDIFDVDKVCSSNKEKIPKMRTGKVAMIIYTSGTTSYPKGVMLSHSNLIANTESILDYLKLIQNNSVLAILPFSYSYGNSILLTHTKVGATLYLYKAIYPTNVLKMLLNNKITGISTVGSYLNILLKQDKTLMEAFKRISYITLAGEKTSNMDLLELQRINEDLKIFVMYGQTEASARLTYLDPKLLRKKIGSVGKPVKNVEIKIIDEKGDEVLCNQIGEIKAKGPNIMLGYLNNITETQNVIKNQWLLTGDMGYKDEEGFIYITGRKKDIIKHLGYRISPTEIESCINSEEHILESAVTDIEIGNKSEIIGAVVPNSKELNMQTVFKHMRRKLEIYKIPKYLFVVDKIPKTLNGKIKRKELKKIFLTVKKEDIYENNF